MKRTQIIFALLLVTASLFAQVQSFQHERANLGQSDSRFPSNLPASYGSSRAIQVQQYRPNQVLVKFADSSTITTRRNKKGRLVASNSRLNNVFQTLGVQEMEQLMPLTGSQRVANPKRIKSVTGKIINDPDLSKLYLMKYDSTLNVSVQDAVTMFESLSEVEFVEPNYIVQIQTLPADTFTSEPFYSMQWGPAAINMPALWNMPKTTTKRPVIAIIDTGVQIDHPDLADNIWTNEAELNGVPGVDDDLNGIIDDIHGYDFVNQSGRVGDWNGHGTHCAGIAAAVGNNGIGITGANPDALIMPITVMQSDGSGDVGTIVRGIDYARANGADILSMSIGGYSLSLAEEQALGKAYQTAILVGAAGNNGLDVTNGHINAFGCAGMPMFPGAFTFVLGTQASQYGPGGQNYCKTRNQGRNPYRCDFSNFDCDGVFSEYEEEKIYNYEILAPGCYIYSTYPGGRYESMCGTSMACPLAAGAISRLIQCKDYVSKELLFGDLIHTSNPYTGELDMLAAYMVTDSMRTPMMEVVSVPMVDSLGDNDGRYDAGEEVWLYPILRNTWGTAENIKVWVTVAENEDTLIATFPDTVPVDFGRTLSCYGKAQCQNPIRMLINPACTDGRRIRLQVHATCDNIGDAFYNSLFTITVENGVELGGILNRNTTLSPDCHYIVNQSLAIPEGITLTIPAGTTLKLKDGVQIVCSGRIRCNGTAENPVIFTKSDLGQGGVDGLFFNNSCIFNYVKFQNLSSNGYNLMNAGKFTNCSWEYCYLGTLGLTGITTTKCNIIYCTGYLGIDYGNTHKYTNIIGNETTNLDPFFGYCPEYNTKWEDLSACNVYANFSDYMHVFSDLNCVVSEPTVRYNDYPSYVGTTVESRARERIMDFYNPMNDVYYHSFGAIDLTNMLTQPSSMAHGIVWKVEVDGFDVQDQKDSLPPLGIGLHRFDVYFNRAMDTTVTPILSMGVRPPYTQVSIATNPSWNAEKTVYTAYLDINAQSYFDGINRIYVGEAQDDEYFLVPTERTRFDVEVQQAGTKSIGFMAEPGMGKITLSWLPTDSADMIDLMGYALYRYTLNDSLFSSDTTRVNDHLIEDTVYIDYDVNPGTTYFYYYKPIRTSFEDVTPSNVVAATPYTAQKGDANGNLVIDVADVVTEIAYLTNENPQPFIFDAADVNSDSLINILDVVGTINLILSPSSSPAIMSINDAIAWYSIEDGILYVDATKPIAGIQLQIHAPQGTEFQVMNTLNGLENMGYWQDEDTYLFLAYSMVGRTIPRGKHALLRMDAAELDEIILSDNAGNRIVAIDQDITGLGTVEAVQMQLPYPNPFNTDLVVTYTIGNNTSNDVTICITDILGRTIKTSKVTSSYGQHTYVWHADNTEQGVYFVTLYSKGVLMQTYKVVKQ